MLVDAVNKMNTWSFMSTKGQGHLLTLDLIVNIFKLHFLNNHLF